MTPENDFDFVTATVVIVGAVQRLVQIADETDWEMQRLPDLGLFFLGDSIRATKKYWRNP
jgi:hypothetical protein